MASDEKETKSLNLRDFSVGLEMVYRDEPEKLDRQQRILKAIDLLKTWRSIYRDLEDEKPFKPVFAVIATLHEDQFE